MPPTYRIPARGLSPFRRGTIPPMMRAMRITGRSLLGIAVLVTAGLTAWAIRTRRPAPREPLTLVLTEDPSLDPHQLLGLRLHLEDHLEALGGWTLRAGEGARSPAAVPRLELHPVRVGSGLALRGRVVFPEGERPINAEGGLPSEVIHRALAPLQGPRGADPLDPGSPEAFWATLPLLAAPRDQPEAEMAGALARAVALKATGPSASLALAEAHLRFRLLVANVDIGEEAHGGCDQAFQEALTRLPGYPRLVILYANFRTDVGDQKGALEMVFRTLATHPGQASLHNAAAYAGRTSGLLTGAIRAARRRDELGGSVGQGYYLVENTLLYSGRWEAFEASLQAGGEPPDPVRAFYLGYVRLLRGTPGAKEAFRASQAGQVGIQSFRVLSAVYLDALEGRRAQALARLRALDEDRARVRVPDGELTFKMAEAYGFLGEDRAAFELAQRAFGQGFACTEWYERAPFLAGLHGRPAWEGLLAALRERQKRMEARFPADRFGN